jgi:hypothetical protein
MQLGASELLEEGRAAHRGGDARRLRACLRELGCRRSREAAVAEESLRKLRLQIGREGVAREEKRAVTLMADAGIPLTDHRKPPGERLAGLLVLKDAEIQPHRERMIEEARSSIWLSSLTFLQARLVPLLESKVRAGCDVTVVFADRTAGSSRNADIGRLHRVGVRCEPLRSTHSKALVVDGELVMVGSANLHGGHHDLCVAFRDAAKAREIVAYLERVISEERQGTTGRSRAR